jgi:hypothetical protein
LGKTLELTFHRQTERADEISASSFCLGSDTASSNAAVDFQSKKAKLRNMPPFNCRLLFFLRVFLLPHLSQCFLISALEIPALLPEYRDFGPALGHMEREEQRF